KIAPQPERKITATPTLAYDLSGMHHGRLYLVYSDQDAAHPDDTDIFVRYSDQDGAMGSWRPRVKVNQDGAGHSQFFPSIAVDPKTGFVAVTFYDTRNDG